MTTSGPTRHGGAHAAATQLPATLARRSDLPPRVHKAFDALLDRAQAYFDATLPKTLDEVEHALFTLAERARNNTQQQRHFEALREMKRGRQDIASRFMQHLESSLAQLRTPAPARAPVETGAGARHSLELVETAALDEGLALRDIAGKVDIRNSQALYAYAHRLAVLTATPVWAVDALPLGPTQLGAALQHALRDLDLAIDTRVLAYRHFDRIALLPIAAFYEGVNTCLIEQQILPNLQRPTTHRRADSGREPPSESAEAVSNATAAAEPTAPVRPRPAAVAPGTSPPAPDASARAPLPEPCDPALFTTLRNLLGEHRQREGEFRPALAGGSRASSDDLQDVLASLQRKPLAAGTTAQGYPHSEHLKNTMMVKLRRASPSGRPLGLAAEDSDTVDLVGMLFNHIATGLRGSSTTRALLGRLHVPVLRVALNDKTFFTRRDHPARELLNTIAETSSRWIDEGDADPDLVGKMQGIVEHVTAEFGGDLGVFENLLGDLSRHMQALARRAEVIERRHVDAARGRDKLEIAREAARSAILHVLRERTPGRIVRNVLEQAWMDALALSVLRHGTDSDEFRRRVAVAEQLAQHDTQPLQDEALRQDLDKGLRQIGLHDDDLQDVLEHLFGRGVPTPEASARVDDALAGRARLGGEPVAATAATGAPPLPFGAAETEQLARLRKTAFGTWFEFVTNQQGRTVARKLAWFSPVSGHCLFVSARGARAEDITLEQLARDMVRGQARMLAIEQVSLIDRAWKAILGALRPQGAGAGMQPEPSGVPA